MTRFWYTEQIEKLIELVSVRPCIWDPNDTDYTDPNSRNEAFKAISKQMGLQPEVVKSKFRNLRAQYFRIYRNPVQRNNPKKWIHYNALRFLNDDSSNQFEVYNNMSISDQEEITNEGRIETEDPIEEVLDEYSSEDFIAKNLYTPLGDNKIETNFYKATSPAKDLDSKTKTEPLSKSRSKPLVMKVSVKEKDAHAIFGEHVASELRSLKHNKRLQHRLKCAILKAIYETNKALAS